MKKLIEEFYQEFGREIVLDKPSEMEPIIKKADDWWEQKCSNTKDYPAPRLRFKWKVINK